MDATALACAMLAAAVYWNTLDAGFVYDDRRAILTNPDVVGNATPSLRRLLSADFWGTPLSHSGSHGSWRPLVTLSFRANHLLGGGWHAANVAGHALCAALLVRLARRLGAAAGVAGAAFALHPVHCEAVAGLVGRADVAAAACALLALLCYLRHVDLRDRPRCRRCGNAAAHRRRSATPTPTPTPPVWCLTVRRFLASLYHPGWGPATRDAKSTHNRHSPSQDTKNSCNPTQSASYNYNHIVEPITEEENNNILDSLEPAAYQNFSTHSPLGDEFNSTYREATHCPYNVGNGHVTSCTLDENVLDRLETDTDRHFSKYTLQGNDRCHKGLDTLTYQDTPHRPHPFAMATTSRYTLEKNVVDNLQPDTDQPFSAHTLQTDAPHWRNHITNGHVTSCTLHATPVQNSHTNCHTISLHWYFKYYVRKLFQWSCRSSAVSTTYERTTQTANESPCEPKTAMSEVCSLNGLSSAFLSDKLLKPILCPNGATVGGTHRQHFLNNNNNTVTSCAAGENFKEGASIADRTATLLKRSSRRAKKRKRFRVDHSADSITQSADAAGCLRCGRRLSTSSMPLSPTPSSLPPLVACVALSTCALLCKETGVAALAVCAAYDAALLLARGLARPRLLLAHRCGRRALASLAALCVCLCCLVAARLAVAGSGGRAAFSRADNPARGAPRLLTRCLTLGYAPAFCWLRLLLAPHALCFDWGMSALPLLHSPLEPRAAAAAAFYAALACALRAALCRPPAQQVGSAGPPPPRHSRAPANTHPLSVSKRVRTARQPVTATVTSDVTTPASSSSSSPCSHGSPLCTCSRCAVPGRVALLVSLSLLVLPYVPASNALFYVGFVAAERVLYLPSAGHCLLLGLGWARLRAATSAGGGRLHALLLVALAVTLASLGARTVVRNRDWRDEESLFRSALHINPPKAYGNLGSVLSSAGRLQEAEWALRQALRHRPNMADVHYNLGNLLARLGRVEEAERSYRAAIHYRPSLAVAYVSLGRLLEAMGRRPEAAQLYARCARLSSEGLRDPAAHEAATAAAGRRLAQLLQAAPEPDTGAAKAADRDLYRHAAAAPHLPAQQGRCAPDRSPGAS
ncbi:protein O-mannosyl-transferase TMTC2-like [Schistocerca gregaria]|uniref:protein O-mannosyl-transferase TMTC2-like n=1 Tax=Schistocerca gregaria TaxID=7010 RepID=UPI00211E5E1C|nr:protein O-mannosyl-transferase TMTC2-like [Schistocerca gregaria]